MYPEQVSNILFNFVDNHDTMRAVTRCGDKDSFYQQLTMLMTMPGSACIYYGTEIALEGGNDPDCRRPMPWSRIEEGKCDRALKEMRALIALRKTCPQTRTGKIIWRHSDTNPRLVCYGRYIEGENTMVTVYLNAGQDPVKMGRNGELLYSRKLRGKTLMSGGIAVYLQDLSE
jgi:glycosidase